MPHSVAPLPKSAAVVIVGGGVIGTSAAFHLAEAGVDVVLLERDELGSGSTCRAAGGVRTQFSDALNIEIAKRSMAAFRDFGRRPGLGDRPSSRSATCSSSAASRTSRSSSAASRCRTSTACASRMLTAGEARELCPLIGGRRHPRRQRSRPATATRRPRASCRATRSPPGPAARRSASAARCSTSRPIGGEITAVVTDAGLGRDRHRDLRRRRLVATLRRDGRRRAAGHAVAAPDPLHRADRRAARPICR